jgi:hypothetical protein
LLALLSEDADELVRERAGNALLSQPLEGFVAALAGDAPAAQLFRYCGHNLIDKPEVATAMAKHWRCPPEFLVAAAKKLPSSAVQELLDDLDKLSANPTLVSALLHSASLSGDQNQQLTELLRENTESEDAFANATSEIDPSRRVTLMQRLSKMRVAERVQMALKGNREERMALIRDPCKVVQRGVLQSPRLTDSEVEFFAAIASLTDDVLRIISASRKFRGNYTVVRNLINNPKTPIDVSLHLLPGITPMDLKALMINKNIPDVLRSSALRLHRKRTAPKDE